MNMELAKERDLQGLRYDIEVIDVTNLHTWERFMGGTDGHNNYPDKYSSRKGEHRSQRRDYGRKE
jgi:hypothetical protein